MNKERGYVGLLVGSLSFLTLLVSLAMLAVINFVGSILSQGPPMSSKQNTIISLEIMAIDYTIAIIIPYLLTYFIAFIFYKIILKKSKIDFSKMVFFLLYCAGMFIIISGHGGLAYM